MASEATKQCKKAMKMGLSLFHTGLNSSKCKTLAKMAVARIKLLRNKREVVVRQMRRDIALLLQSRQDATARIRVEHVIREQNILVANEFLELFCELIVARLSIIAKHRECPADLKEGVSSLIFAAPRCSEIPELLGIRDVFKKRYGKDFVSAATDLRPNAGVNRMLIEKLSVRAPSGEVKLKVLKDIAKEYKVDWDTTESETELLKPLEELIDGPPAFVSASSFPIKPVQKEPIEHNKLPSSRQEAQDNSEDNMHFEDSETAAEAAAKAAKRAIDAAQAAAHLSSKDIHESQSNISVDAIAVNGNRAINAPNSEKYGLHGPSHSDGTSDKVVTAEARLKRGTTFENVHSSRGSRSSSEVDAQKAYRQNGYNITPAHSYNQFDESDYDEEIEVEKPPSFDDLPSNRSPDDANTRHMMLRRKPGNNYDYYSANPEVMFDASDHEDDTVEESIRGTKPPPNRPAPYAPPTYLKQNSVPSPRRKLPELDSLAARFEALRYQKFQP
ncbi:hypothetical protein Leryth_013002 [Lithospermum erythrorhizon]|nr:hypothetical protein Leryth_013002 [Lithospermum erythrorhizon]